LLGRLKVNIGNIFFKQRQFAKAIKNYRMALDQVPNAHASIKYVRCTTTATNAAAAAAGCCIYAVLVQLTELFIAADQMLSMWMCVCVSGC